jgi:hypothetical protein
VPFDAIDRRCLQHVVEHLCGERRAQVRPAWMRQNAHAACLVDDCNDVLQGRVVREVATQRNDQLGSFLEPRYVPVGNHRPQHMHRHHFPHANFAVDCGYGPSRRLNALPGIDCERHEPPLMFGHQVQKRGRFRPVIIGPNAIYEQVPLPASPTDGDFRPRYDVHATTIAEVDRFKHRILRVVIANRANRDPASDQLIDQPGW